MNFLSKIAGFTITYAQWAASGFPRRDPEWVKEIFAEQCTPCEFYAPDGTGPLGGEGLCELCGCHVANNDDPRNKITLPNTACPIGKWGAVVEKKPKSSYLARRAKPWRRKKG